MQCLWERQPGESAKAFAAWCHYRDLGPGRSLALAYAEWRRGSGGSGDAAKAAGYWQEWSAKYEWVARAAAYDAHLEEIRRLAREDAIRTMEIRRLDFELKNQDRLEARVAKMEALLDKADKHPLTDVVQEKEEAGDRGRIKTIRTKIKGLGALSGYARLAAETNRTAAEAINGVRPVKKDAGTAESVRKPGGGVFVWVKPADPEAAESSGEK